MFVLNILKRLLVIELISLRYYENKQNIFVTENICTILVEGFLLSLLHIILDLYIV